MTNDAMEKVGESIGDRMELTLKTAGWMRVWINRRRSQILSELSDPPETEEGKRRARKAAEELAVNELLPFVSNVDNRKEFYSKLMGLLRSQRKTKKAAPEVQADEVTTRKVRRKAALRTPVVLEDGWFAGAVNISPQAQSLTRTMLDMLTMEAKTMAVGAVRRFDFGTEGYAKQAIKELTEATTRAGWGKFPSGQGMFMSRRVGKSIYVARLG